MYLSNIINHFEIWCLEQHLGNSHDRVCCIEYTWLFVNTQFITVLRILHFKCIFFGLLNNLTARNQHNFWETYENIYTFFIHTFEHMKNMCISVSHFQMKIINNKHTLLYNFTTIWLCELTNLIKCSMLSFWSLILIKKNPLFKQTVNETPGYNFNILEATIDAVSE